MTVRRVPRAAQALLRCFAGGRHSESLEGDLLEQFATGRTVAWYWRQVACAIYERAFSVARQQAATFLAAALFFLVALSVIAPVTWPIMGWARPPDPLHVFVLMAWLAGVPLVLGAVAGSAQRRKRPGAILLGAAFAYLSPVTLPFSFAVCDLCARPTDTTIPAAIQLLTPLGSVLLAGLGAWVAGNLRSPANPEEYS